MEQADRTGPEPLELRAQLAAQRHPGVHEILPRAGQRPERLCLIRVGLEHPEAMAVGARQLAQHERVEPVGLAARGPEPRPRGRDLFGMHRQHPQPRVQQPLDQQPVRPLDRDQLHLQPQQRPAQRPQPLLVVHERGGQQLLARLVAHAHIVLIARPIDAGAVTHPPSSPSGIASQLPDQEVPLRNLIDKALNGATSCCRSSAPHHRRETPVCFLALHTGQGLLALPGGGRGHTSMTYEVSAARTTSVSHLANCAIVAGRDEPDDRDGCLGTRSPY